MEKTCTVHLLTTGDIHLGGIIGLHHSMCPFWRYLSLLHTSFFLLHFFTIMEHKYILAAPLGMIDLLSYLLHHTSPLIQVHMFVRLLGFLPNSCFIVTVIFFSLTFPYLFIVSWVNLLLAIIPNPLKSIERLPLTLKGFAIKPALFSDPLS